MIGIDLVETSRFDKLLTNNNFIKKTFSDNEKNYINTKQNKAQTAAGIFAAKEAFLKALEIGIFNGIEINKIEVLHKENGAPFLNLNKHTINNIDIDYTEISITHDAGFAMAVCYIKTK